MANAIKPLSPAAIPTHHKKSQLLAGILSVIAAATSAITIPTTPHSSHAHHGKTDGSRGMIAPRWELYSGDRSASAVAEEQAGVEFQPSWAW
jgi:hypothetical protein